MQKVSKEYQASMSSPLRERAFIQVSFGLINQTAQTEAKLRASNESYYSSSASVLTFGANNVEYATLERNFTKVDGSMRFLPREDLDVIYHDTGIVSENTLETEEFALLVNFGSEEISFKGFSIDFGYNYPTEFKIFTNKGKRLDITNNDKSLWVTDETFDKVQKITILVRKMKYDGCRVRIKSLQFGLGLVYGNEYVLDSSLESYVSPISADIPQIDFMVKLKNDDKYFNVDNPKSAINYFETGQQLSVMYGYKLPDSNNVEWVKGGQLVCTEWESDDNTATIRGTDLLRGLDREYSMGQYSSVGVSYYDVLTSLFREMGIKKYYIEPRLRLLKLKNPIPRVKLKEAIQLLANACRCTVSQSRWGEIQIKSNYIPELSISSDDGDRMSNLANVLKPGQKVEFARLDRDYTTVDGSMFFANRTGVSKRPVGFVSNRATDSTGVFANPVKIAVTMDNIRAYYNVNIEFGNTLPSLFTIDTYNNGVNTNTFTVDSSEISKKMSVIRDFGECDKMVFSFEETIKPNNHVVVRRIGLETATNFMITRRDMLSSPKAIKQESIKEIIVPYYTYQESDKVDVLISEDIEVSQNQVITYYFDSPCYDFNVLVDDRSNLASVVSKSNYAISLRYQVVGKHKLEIKGRKYNIIEKQVGVSLNTRGRVIKWSNPLLSDEQMANQLLQWLKEYYTSGIEYEYDTRGNPELDANDIVNQENEFHPDMKVCICKYNMKFANSFSASVVARRQGG
jgi:hypothetical protein|nr:MAG TPA: hypothetical protein [Caudoviricetes sp.]